MGAKLSLLLVMRKAWIWPKREWQLWNKPAQEAAVRTASASDRFRPKVTTATIRLRKTK